MHDPFDLLVLHCTQLLAEEEPCGSTVKSLFASLNICVREGHDGRWPAVGNALMCAVEAYCREDERSARRAVAKTLIQTTLDALCADPGDIKLPRHAPLFITQYKDD